MLHDFFYLVLAQLGRKGKLGCPIANAIIANPDRYTDVILPAIIEATFDAAEHLAFHGQPKVAMEIVGQLERLDKRAKDWL